MPSHTTPRDPPPHRHSSCHPKVQPLILTPTAPSTPNCSAQIPPKRSVPPKLRLAVTVTLCCKHTFTLQQVGTGLQLPQQPSPNLRHNLMPNGPDAIFSLLLLFLVKLQILLSPLLRPYPGLQHSHSQGHLIPNIFLILSVL